LIDLRSLFGELRKAGAANHGKARTGWLPARASFRSTPEGGALLLLVAGFQRRAENVAE
jgi:hypothetical protein